MLLRRATASLLAAVVLIATAGSALAAPVGWAKCWSELVDLSSPANLVSSPTAVADGDDNIHLVWADSRSGEMKINYEKISRTGSVLIPAKAIGGGRDSTNPTLGPAGKDGLWLAWEDFAAQDYRIFYGKLDGNGSFVIGPKVLVQSGSPLSGAFVAGSPDGRAYFVWSDARDSNNEIYASAFAPDGKAVFEARRLTSDATSSIYPSAAVGAGGKVLVTWRDESTSSASAFYTVIDGGGNVLTPRTPLANLAFKDRRRGPQALATRVDFAVVYTGLVPPENVELYMSTVSPDGAVVSRDIRLTQAPRLSVSPWAAVDQGGNLRVIWLDTREQGLTEIFYKVVAPSGEDQVSDTKLSVKGAGETGGTGATYPFLLVDSQGATHAFWRNLAGTEQFAIKYMNTALPATTSKASLMGLDERRPLSSLAFTVIGAIPLAGLYTLSDALISMWVVVGLALLLRKFGIFGENLRLSPLLLFTMLLLIKSPSNPATLKPLLTGTAYALFAAAVASLLVLALLHARKMKFEDELTTAWVSALWLFLVNLILVIPSVAMVRFF